jgi:hypothetical protein
VNPFVFLVGCPRSGTTLLRRMVDSHSAIAITRETHFIPKLYERRPELHMDERDERRAGVTVDGRVTPALLPRLLADRRFVRLGVGRQKLEELIAGDGETPSYAGLIAAVFDLYGESRGKAVVGDKTPGYVRNMGTLHGLWPRARFVHLIRDGRDVCLSVLGWSRGERTAGRFASWAEDPVTTAALWWEWSTRLGRERGGALGPHLYRELRYESLVSDPAGACAELCAFLDQPYEEAMVSFHEGRERDRSGLSAKKAWRPVSAGLRDWRAQMPSNDVERCEAAAGTLLDELGYERTLPRPGRRALAHAARLRESFAAELASRSLPAPEAFLR